MPAASTSGHQLAAAIARARLEQHGDTALPRQARETTQCRAKIERERASLRRRPLEDTLADRSRRRRREKVSELRHRSCSCCCAHHLIFEFFFS